jgi:hypothetical protein
MIKVDKRWFLAAWLCLTASSGVKLEDFFESQTSTLPTNQIGIGQAIIETQWHT